MKNKILFLTPYPYDSAGSQRFRFEQYIEALRNRGFQCEFQAFISSQTWEILYQKGYLYRKAVGMLAGFAKRLFIFRRMHLFDFVFIHREASPVGPPIFEWLMAKIWRKKIIYDFDDAIWQVGASKENKWVDRLKFSQKVKNITRWAYRISVGNHYLADFARQFNKNVSYNPTTIDTLNRHIPVHKYHNPICIGWTGTHSTLPYLERLRDILLELSGVYDFEFLVIADQAPDLALSNQKYLPWQKESEIADLNVIDIGVMPLDDNDWAKGKCGFKALQFMALEKPVLVTPVGVNKEIVEDGVHGFHCHTPEDWMTHLKTLLADPYLRNKMGKAGRKKVEEEFSVTSNTDNFLELFAERL